MLNRQVRIIEPGAGVGSIYDLARAADLLLIVSERRIVGSFRRDALFDQDGNFFADRKLQGEVVTLLTENYNAK